MNEQQTKQLSKFLSYILRHHPESIGLELDAEGWADVAELLEKSKFKYPELTKNILDMVVSTNEKKRFAFSEDESKIRASQGHSIDIELNLEARRPPEFLFHGTVEKFLEAIKQEGLKKMGRQHVHLSADEATATNVGSRRGKPVILLIQSAQMHRNGYLFYQSANGVWLTDHVPVQFITN